MVVKRQAATNTNISNSGSKKLQHEKRCSGRRASKGFKLELHLDQLSVPGGCWLQCTCGTSGRRHPRCIEKEKYGCAAKPTIFVPGWRLCKQNTYLSNAVYGSDIWNFSGLTLGLFSHNRIYPRMHPSCPPLPRHLPPCILSSPLCIVHTAFMAIPRTQDPVSKSTWQIHCCLYPFYMFGVSFT